MAVNTVLNASTDRAAWLEARRKTITATDVAALLGLHPYRTARNIYLEKTGQAVEQEETEAMMIGQELEPFIAALYCRKSGLVFGKDVISTGFKTHPSNPRYGATPDFEDIPGKCLVECKYAGPNALRNFGEDGSDEVPTQYLVQCMWQMFVTGHTQCVLVLFTAFGKLKTYPIAFDAELVRRMVFKVNLFIGEYLDAKMPPPLSGFDPDTEYVTKEFPAESPGKIIACSYALEETVAELVSATHKEREASQEVTRCKNVLREFMGDAEVMETDAGRFTWKQNKPSKKTDWETVAEGLKNYLCIALAEDKDRHGLMMNEYARLLDAHTTTSPGARVFRTPIRSERA